MKHSKLILSLVIPILITGCDPTENMDARNKNNTAKLKTDAESSESFLPMHIGNYWKTNDQNYTKITDTMRIDGKLYYEFHSLIGGDAVSTQYLRIDQDQNLIEGYPDNPDQQYIHAKFNADVNDTFYTLNDQSVNDYKVTVITKTDSLMQFEFRMIHHPNLSGSTHTTSYIQGLGWKDNWKEIRINGKIHSF